MDLQVEESMTTGLLTTKESDSLSKAYMMMQEEKVRHLLVKNDHEIIEGLISERDIERAFSKRRHWDSRKEPPQFDRGETVGDYMSRPVEAIDGHVQLACAIERMLDKKISALAVNNGKEIIGIVTTDDLLKILHQILRTEHGASALTKWFSKPRVSSAIDFLNRFAR